MQNLEYILMGEDLILPNPKDLIHLHNDLIEATSGLSGDIEGKRMYSVVHGMQYWEDQSLQALSAYLLSRIAKGHMFNDCNKRTAYFGSRYFLMLNGADFNGVHFSEASEQVAQIAGARNIEEAYKIAFDIASADVVKSDFKVSNYRTFHRLIIKSIGVAKRLEDS